MGLGGLVRPENTKSLDKKEKKDGDMLKSN